MSKDEVVLGQYDGYNDVEGVADDSQTDTFVAARLWVDTDRWHGVPFLLRTGKMMAEKAERVTLIMSLDEQLSFDLTAGGSIEVTLTVKRPGPSNETDPATATIALDDIGDTLEPYERLIHDAIKGDKGRFTRPDGLRYAWQTIAPLLKDKPDVIKYPTKTWGPEEAAALAAPYGWLEGAVTPRDG